MAWKGSFQNCWLRMQSIMTRDPDPQFCIINHAGDKGYELHNYDDLLQFLERPEDYSFRIVVCPTPKEMKALIRTGQFNLFEEAPDADPETAPQTGE